MNHSAYNTLKTQLHSNGILEIILHRPDKLNALSAQLLDELHQVLLMAKTTPEVKALLISGEGKSFCAGADITQLLSLTGPQGFDFSQSGQQIFRLLEKLGKPSLAAVNGYAFGGGCELALAATLRIASTQATFGQPEVKLGIIPGYGGTQRLARLVGKGRALDLCLTGRSINANTALAWGLVSEVVAPEQLLERAKQILVNILSMAPLAVNSVMQVIDAGFDLSLEEAFHLEAVHFGLTCSSQDKQEGIKAFLDKRSAEFKGE